jgi:hypothetical protein
MLKKPASFLNIKAQVKAERKNLTFAHPLAECEKRFGYTGTSTVTRRAERENSLAGCSKRPAS